MTYQHCRSLLQCAASLFLARFEKSPISGTIWPFGSTAHTLEVSNYMSIPALPFWVGTDRVDHHAPPEKILAGDRNRQTAMLANLPYQGLRDAILAHPTMAEGLGSLFSNVPSMSV